MKYLFIAISLMFSTIIFAQFVDDFSDGNFINPLWLGDTSNFIINDNEVLQLNAPEAGFSYIYSYVDFPSNPVWEFYVKMDFAPSSANYSRVFLLADEFNFNSASGFYLQLGETGSEDAVNLYKLDNGESELLIEATESSIATEPAIIRIKIEYVDGEWKMFCDYSGGDDFILEGTSNLNFNFSSGYFVLGMKYTSTRTDKFFFDDISISEYTPDLSPPELVDLTIIDENNLTVLFNESLNESVLNTDMFMINNDIGNPISVEFDGSPKKIHLSFDNSFEDGIEYQLSCSDIEDFYSNTTNITESFVYTAPIIARAYDILINEIMADPTPSINLPEYEFVELYNVSDKSFNLEDYSIESGGSPGLFPDYTLDPDSYVVVCDIDDIEYFSDINNVLGITNLPGFSNNGDIILLRNNLGEEINDVYYTKSWYADAIKAEGGWTLELINPFAPCSLTNNWSASTNINGGTPGFENSILENFNNNSGPQPISALALSSFEIAITFDKNLDLNNIPGEDFFEIDAGPDVISTYILSPTKNKIALILNGDLEQNIIYDLIINQGISDCTGTFNGNETKLQIGLAQEPENGDLIFNELLFDAKKGGSEFIELYNTSSKPINISDTYFVMNEGSDVLRLPDFMLLPDKYVAIAQSAELVRKDYSPPNNAQIISFLYPSLNDKADSLRLITFTDLGEEIKIDDFQFSDKMHSQILSDKDGVSLERIKFDGQTNDASNWHSAASIVNFATPGYKNSQYLNDSDVSISPFELLNKTISPNDDGYKDVLALYYEVENAGMVLNGYIYNSNGFLVSQIFNNLTISTKGTLIWNGYSNDDIIPPYGLYVLILELTDVTKGKSKKYKYAFAIAGE